MQIKVKKNRHDFIRPLRKAGLAFFDIKKFGFVCSTGLWKNCLNRLDRNLGGRPRLPSNLKSELHQHMKELSDISSNRAFI